jgi:pyruvate dehydrogenase E1 component beta subunit
VRAGDDVTLVGASYSTYLCEQAAEALAAEGVQAAVVDLRVLNPLDPSPVIESVAATGRLCVVDGGWRTAGLAGEIIAAVVEHLGPGALRSKPQRVTLPDAPAPTSRPLEDSYYPKVHDVVRAVKATLTDE